MSSVSREPATGTIVLLRILYFEPSTANVLLKPIKPILAIQMKKVGHMKITYTLP